ncbi:MAG: hypothetical protein HYZ21_16650 [Chloroflexi bacterium]|nr:hypothetical protein [Chloroflexota bacterium]
MEKKNAPQRKRKSDVVPAKGTSIAVGGDVSYSNIINGSKNIINVIEKSTSVVELKKQADRLEQSHLKNALVEYVNKIKLQAELAEKGLDTKSPYKALLKYEITDSSLFFGRDAYIAELLECIKQNPLTVLHSESGAGKSSLLRAGIGPHLLAEGRLPLYIRPRETPVLQTSIKHALLPDLEQSPNLTNARLRDFLRRVCKLLGKKWLLIIVDQFEEIFTLQSEEARMAFVKELAECLDDETLPVRWILSLRGEWFSQLAKFQSKIGNPFENSVFLSAFNKADAYQVIVEPALKRGIRYEDGLVEQIIAELATKADGKADAFSSFLSSQRESQREEEEISPPQLQLVCSEIFKKADKNTHLVTTETYRLLGGAETILQNYLDRVIDENIPKEHVELAEKILVALVDDEGHRVLRSKQQIQLDVSFKVDPKNLDEVIKQLVDSHLLRVEEDEYELAHDYLANKIKLDPETQKQKYVKELLEQKTKHFHREGIKLSTEELSLVEKHLSKAALSDDEMMLIESSRRDSLLRRYLSLGGYMVVFAIGVSLFIVAVTFLIRGMALVAPQGYIALLWASVIALGFIGANRGWVKELLLTFGLILSIAINKLIVLIPIVGRLEDGNTSLFWIRLVITATMAYFGYQAVVSIQHLSFKSNRERLQDSLFGASLGAINGYLLMGSIWYYLHVMGYTDLGFLPPTLGTLAGDASLLVINYLPPYLFSGVGLFLAVILVIVFVLVVYI